MNLFDLCVYKNLNKGSGGDVDVSSLVATENKTYNAGEGKAYNPVVVNVPTPSPSLQSLTASHNGYFVPSSGYDGFDEVTVEVATPLETLSATENGTYTPSSGYEGFSEVTVNVPLPNNAYLLESQKDDVVTIQHGAEFDMPKLVADITPKQDLHGYDAPWVGGAGKNKLPNGVNTMTKNGITITKNIDGTYTLNGTSTNGNTTICLNSPTGEVDEDYDLSLPNGDYYLSGLSGGTTSTYRMNVDISISDHQSRSVSHFDGDTPFTIENNNICSVTLWINKEGQTFNNFVISPMIRSTTESSTFEPYENDCPISGWTACNVVRSGKNLVNWKWNTFNDGKMEIFLKGGTYTLSAESALINGNAYIRGTKPSGEYVSREELGLTDWGASSTSGVYYGGSGQQTYTFNVPNGGAKIEFGKLNNNGTINAQLEVGSQATAYEPYSGNTYTINFVDGSSPLTVYGGTIELVKVNGEWKWKLTGDRGQYTIDENQQNITIQSSQSYGTVFRIVTGQSCIQNNTQISNQFKFDNNAWQINSNRIGTFVLGSEGNLYVQAPPSVGTTIDAFRTWLTSHNIQINYELATPQTYYINVDDLPDSLEGVNNIFADTGEVDVQIWTKEVTS